MLACRAEPELKLEWQREPSVGWNSERQKSQKDKETEAKVNMALELAAVRSAVALEQLNNLGMGSGVYIPRWSLRSRHCAGELAVLKKNDGETKLQAAEQQETQLRG